MSDTWTWTNDNGEDFNVTINNPGTTWTTHNVMPDNVTITPAEFAGGGTYPQETILTMPHDGVSDRLADIEKLLNSCLVCGVEAQVLCTFCRESVKHSRKALMKSIIGSIAEMEEGTDDIPSRDDV